MVSRRKILSRSRDDLNMDAYLEEEEDVWYTSEKLYRDHIQEVLQKWESIDDEIWAKVIVFERNRRVAKAYARAPVLTVNGSDDGFDGFRIGLCGFDNPLRDPKTDEVKRHIGHGVKVKMDDQGNILIKRVAKSSVYVKYNAEENSVNSEILKYPQAALEHDKPLKLFDMKKFSQNMSREMKRAYPDRSRLEVQCLTALAFVRNETNVLDCPIWVLIINVVAMDMLKSKLPPVKTPISIKNRPRIPIPDEDPYSIAGSGGSSGSSGKERRTDKPPKLPPRDNGLYSKDVPRPDYEDSNGVEESVFRKLQNGRSKEKRDKKHDDPYYCGLRARIPNFAKSKQKERERIGPDRYLPPLPGHHPMGPPMQPMWHSRSFDSGMAQLYMNNQANAHKLMRNPNSYVMSAPTNHESDQTDSPYSVIYGRLPLPNRVYTPAPAAHRRAMYVGDWR